MDNHGKRGLSRLFLFSMVIIVLQALSIVLGVRKMFTGFSVYKYNIYTDFVFIGISIAVYATLLYIPNKYWRLGLLFALASNITKHLSVMISQQSFIVAIFLSFISILFMIPAFLYFYKLKVNE